MSAWGPHLPQDTTWIFYFNLKLGKVNLRWAHASLPFPRWKRRHFASFRFDAFWPQRLAVVQAEAFTSWGDGDWDTRFASAIRSIREGAPHREGEHLWDGCDRAHQAGAERLPELWGELGVDIPAGYPGPKSSLAVGRRSHYLLGIVGCEPLPDSRALPLRARVAFWDV